MILSADKIEKSYKGKKVVKGISLSVKQGEIVGLLGPNGAGKSTILRMMAGIYSPDDGVVRITGRCVLLAGIGTGFQSNLTGRENIKFTHKIK